MKSQTLKGRGATYCASGFGRNELRPYRPPWIVLPLVATILAAACSPAPPGSGDQRGGAANREIAPSRTLVLAARVEMPSIAARPLRSSGLTSSTVTRLFNAGLAIQDERAIPHAYLAEALPELNTDSWRLFPDARMETTYRLRPGLVWHDGTPLTPDDFVFSWEVYLSPELGTSDSPPISFIEGITAPDSRTLVIRWRQPFPEAGSLRASGGGGDSSGRSFTALPRHILEQPFRRADIETFAAHPFWSMEYVGLGPYRLDRWEAGAFLEGAAFDRHALGKPRIPRIRVLFVPDPNTVVANVLAGAAHMTVDDSIRFQQGLIIRREWASRDGGTVLVYPSLWRWTQVQQRPEYASPRALLDVRVRRALAHTVDKQALSEALFEGEGIPSDSAIPPTVDYFARVDRVVTKHPFDPVRAQQLMAEAGFVKGADGTYVGPTGRFATELNTLGSAQNEAELSIMAAGWRQAGFEVKEVVWSPAQGADRELRNTFPGLSNTSGSSGERALDDYQSSELPRPEKRWSGQNRGGWRAPPEFDRLADAFNTTLDREQRTQQAVEMARLMTNDVAVISLYFNPTVTAFARGLAGPRVPAPEGSLPWNIHEWEFR